MNKKELEEALIFPQGEKNPYGAYFTGQSYLEGMIADKDLPFGVGNVTFEP
ncbi:MAG: cupin domain-containing protein, partial [Lactococcus lactis]